MDEEFRELEGVITGTSPATLLMNGTHPIGIKIFPRPNQETLKDLEWRKVKIIVFDEYDKPWER